MKSKFTWGDAVVIKQTAPKHLHPGEFGSICGISQCMSLQEAEQFEDQEKGCIYTVEFENGSDIQIAECYLDKDLRIVRGKELTKYNKHFIDGLVLKTKIELDFIEIYIKSLPIHQSIPDSFLLSEDGCFNGKVIATQIENITIANSSRSIGLQEKGTILSFEISDEALKICIEWDLSKTKTFEIKSGQIWWEKQ